MSDNGSRDPAMCPYHEQVQNTAIRAESDAIRLLVEFREFREVDRDWKDNNDRQTTELFRQLAAIMARLDDLAA